MERAIQAGKSQADFACLFEILSDATVVGQFEIHPLDDFGRSMSRLSYAKP
jgi:hypothetical protein